VTSAQAQHRHSLSSDKHAAQVELARSASRKSEPVLPGDVTKKMQYTTGSVSFAWRIFSVVYNITTVAKFCKVSASVMSLSQTLLVPLRHYLCSAERREEAAKF